MMISSQQKFSKELPALYGDHHVVELRRILLALPGVTDVYASSSFRIVEVSYDPAQVTPDAITTALGEAGYLGELPIPAEEGRAATSGNGDRSFFRHTAVYEQTHPAVSFNQVVAYRGRPLWMCPGMGVIKTMEE